MDSQKNSYVPIGRGSPSGRGRGFRRAIITGGEGETETDVPEVKNILKEKAEDIIVNPVGSAVKKEPSPLEVSPSSHTQEGSQNNEAKANRENLENVIKVGVAGERCQCLANFVKLRQTNNVHVYEYIVSMKPALESTKYKKTIIKQIEPVVGPVSNFDGQSLFLPHELDKKINVIPCFNPMSGTEIETTIRLVGRKEFSDLCQFYNILFQRIMTKLGFIEIRKGYYEISELKDLPNHKLQLWPGISLNVEIKDGGMMVMVDTPCRIIRGDTAYDYYKAFLNAGNDYKKEFENFIVGKIIRCGYNQKCYKVDDVDWNKNPTSEFTYKSSLISFRDYFKKQYGVNVQDLQQPMLVSQVKPKNLSHSGPVEDIRIKAVALVPETCHLTGLTFDQRSNPKIMAEIRSHVRQNPVSRVNTIQAVIQKILASDEAQYILQQWGITLDEKVLGVIGRTLDAPVLLFHKNDIGQSVQSDFHQKCRSCIDSVEITKFLVLCSEYDRQKAVNFISEYSVACAAVGIRLRTKGDIVTVDGKMPKDYVKVLETHCRPGNMQFVVIILQGFRDDIYKAIKKYCLTTFPIPSQCVLTKSLNPRHIHATTLNICMQINCKLGGSLWGLKIPWVRETLDYMGSKVMFIGMDVAHDPTRKNPSVVALIATLNDTSSKIFSRCDVAPIHQEVNTCLRPMLLDALDCYRAQNGEFPSRIIFYRDGGSAATFDVLREHEIDVSLKILGEIDDDGDKKIEFSYICVAKRIPQKILLCTEQDDVVHPPSGTVVDTVITKPCLYDFYIVSQSISQPAISPTHYTVLSETNATSPDMMQKLAYLSTYMYYNWAGAIKVPAVVQYAHKLGQLCSRAQAIPRRELSQQLHFL